MEQDRLLTLADVRQQVSVSRATIWRWINERGLKVVRVGDVTRIRQSVLDEFIAKHESTITPRRRQRFTAVNASKGESISAALSSP